jgi:hypothetical protein
MKTINVTFEDQEIKDLIKAKGKQSWKEFILQLKGSQKSE